MFNNSWFRRIMCLLLVFCFAFCTFGQIKASADLGALLLSMGTSVGITPETAIACILILLGVAVVAGNADAFWDLVEQIKIDRGSQLTDLYTIANGSQAALVSAWYYDDTYYFPQETIEIVHDYLLEDTVTYDPDTDSLVHSGYVYNGWTTTFGEGTLDKALTWLFCNYPDSYEFANNCSNCTALHFEDGTWRYVFSDTGMNAVTDEAGVTVWYYPDEFIAVHVNADGSFTLATDSYDEYLSAIEEGLFYYKARIPIDTSNLARNLEDYQGLRVIECSGKDPDKPDQDITIPLIGITIIGTSNGIEDMTMEEAQSGENSEPDVVVDLDTGEVIEANGDNADSVFGRYVSVDAETAIASILISLGVLPGSSNVDFRQLINDIISVLPSEYIYDFESAAYGNMVLLNAWLYNDIYYFSQDIMEFVNNYIWGNTEYSTGIFTSSATSYETTEVASATLNLINSTTYGIWNNVYFTNFPFPDFNTFADSIDGIIFNDTLYVCDCVYDNALGENTIGSKYWFNGTGAAEFPFFFRDYISSYMKVYVDKTYSSPVSFTFVTLKEIVSFGAIIDVLINNISSALSDFSFDILTVEENGADLTYYPVKLFPSLDDAEGATQTEIQTDYTTSVPAISVDLDSEVIIEVNIPGSEDVPEVDPDPTTSTNPDSGSDNDSESGNDPDATTSTYPGGGTGSGDSDSDSDTSADGNGAVTEDGLWGVLVRFGLWLVDLLWSPFRWLGQQIWNFIEWLSRVLLTGLDDAITWLAEALVAGFQTLIEWLNENLLAGFRSIMEWLADAILSGIQELFVPQEDFLSEKIDKLCEDFVFAYAIVETAEFIRDSLSGLGTSPPVIYLNLGSASGSFYWGGQVAFIDMSWYAAYKPVGDALLSALLWICFCWRVFVKLPGIISGVSGQFSHFTRSDS